MAEHLRIWKTTVQERLKQFQIHTRQTKTAQLSAHYNPQQVPFGYRYLNGALVQRQMALEAVARPWPSLSYKMKQNNDRDPFMIVKKDGHTYIVHKDRLKKKR